MKPPESLKGAVVNDRATARLLDDDEVDALEAQEAEFPKQRRRRPEKDVPS